jgi:hypothetical protein
MLINQISNNPITHPFYVPFPGGFRILTFRMQLAPSNAMMVGWDRLYWSVGCLSRDFPTNGG